VTGLVGSGIVLVPGAQTFESLKDLSVLLCVLLFGYPALLAVPPAYMLSDLIEGVPPAFIQDWFLGYFINPAFFWVAYQLIGKEPDFRRARTWRGYLIFVAFFMAFEPPLWGYICSEQFTAEIAYGTITPALFFTTGVTWLLAPLAMLVALPLARKYGLFWADVSGRVRERSFALRRWVWESGRGAVTDAGLGPPVLPVQVFLTAPLIALILLMVCAVAYVALERGRDTAQTLADRLLQEVSDGLCARMEEREGGLPASAAIAQDGGLRELLDATRVSRHGRVFIVNRAGRLLARAASGGAAEARATPSSKGAGARVAVALASETSDPVVRQAVGALSAVGGRLGADSYSGRFEFDVVTARPLARETWRAQATLCASAAGPVDWVLVAAMPEADFMSGVREGASQAAVVVAVALILSLLVAPLLAGAVTAPMLAVSRFARAMAAGDLSQRVPPSRLEELGTVAASFNHMAEQLEQSRRELDVDIQRREEVERTLRASEQHLEALVTERTQALVLANKKLESFSYSVSHDLRSPVRVIHGFATILVDQYAARLDDDGRRYLDRILRATRRMSGLIDSLLCLAQVNRRELKVEPVDLAELAQDVLRDLHAAHPGPAIDVQIGPDLSTCADPVLMHQLLQNLLGNAWKYTNHTSEPRIELGRACLDGQDTFYVSDNGVGFDMAYASKLFGVFERLHSDPEFEGTGVGLAIVAHIIERHGGRVWAEAAVGKGATFYFTLPERVEAATAVSA